MLLTGQTLTKGKKQSKSKPDRRDLAWYLWLAIGLGIAGVVIGVRTYHFGELDNTTHPGEFKAAIIDQLYTMEPNQDFVYEVTKDLEEYGFKVDLYHGDEVTVDLYRKLPTYGYKLIIFRAHSGMLGDEGSSYGGEVETTFLFTSENYQITERVWEQLGDQILPARMIKESPMVFAVNSNFILKSMEGSFTDTAIIMMGCSTAYKNDMAQAFIQKGASVYLGWSASVDLNYVDEATLELVNNLCTEGMPIEEALAQMLAEVGLDPYYNAQPKYYPSWVGNKTIAELY